MTLQEKIEFGIVEMLWGSSHDDPGRIAQGREIVHQALSLVPPIDAEILTEINRAGDEIWDIAQPYMVATQDWTAWAGARERHQKALAELATGGRYAIP